MKKMRCRITLLGYSVWFILIFLVNVTGNISTASLRAGIAEREITPQESVPLWGYASRHDSLSTGVIDPLMAEALVMEIGTNKVAIVSLDLGRTPDESSLARIRAAIATRAGIEHAFISASHTHSGPVVELAPGDCLNNQKLSGALEYPHELETIIIQVVLDADRNRIPARMSVGTRPLKLFSRNRQFLSHPDFGDPDLCVLRLDNLSGVAFGLLVNFSAHPTLVEPSGTRFSADYIGAFRLALKREMHVDTVFIQGAAGDQSIDGAHGNDPTTFGEALACEVLKIATNSVKPVADPRSFEVTEDKFQFPSRIKLKDPVVHKELSKLFFPELIASYERQYSSGVEPVLTIASIDGAIFFVGVSGEFFGEHSVRLKQRAKVPAMFFLGYCNGYQQYFPTIEAVAEGGYGTESYQAPAAIGSGEEIMNVALMRILQLKGLISRSEPLP